ncbi:InlB B-repeat-containing protein [Agathobaculum butyriciproducens]|uniref:InlB B-repeat-containing protein n=1 Tax=Agathobaculum butyriciproducens TaxID=1628085 RepID=UPI001D084C35|nr:S-layer homology domain-containing protein [Agathobaculum butyriciproducens]MCQ5046197.1 S-layer homology domain-containing protein [Agathobaculum butyriciproducens]
MKKQICSLLLICSMLAGLLPQIVLPQAAAADTAAARDGFGLPTEEKTGITDAATLRNNPYGTLGWVPLFQNHELVVAGVDSDEFQTTYEGAVKGKGGQMSTFRWSNSTEVGNAERIATVAFDPNGTGKDEYIANLVFDKSSERLRLYVTNKDRKVSNVVQIGDGNDSEYIKKLKFYQTRAMLSLAAGDFDGDGKDTLMIYTPGNNKDTATVDSIKEYTFSGSTLTDNGRVINLGDVIDGGRDALKAMLYHDGNGDNELRAHLSVDMEVGDVDMDGIDELAMTVNVNDLKESEYKLDGKTYTDFEKSYLTVYDYNNSNKWSQMTKQTLLNSSGGASGRARFAGVTIGYVSDAPSGSMPPEVVAVGYYDKKDNYKDCEFDKSKLLAYSYQYSTKDNSWTDKCKATEVVTNGFTNTGTKGDDVQNPIAVAAVAADGVNTQEYLFISGSMYKVGTVNGSQQLSILDGSNKGHDRWLGGRLINNSGILDYAVGNFDGNKQGMEQVYYVEYRKQETFDKQFLKIGQLYKGSAGSTFSRWEDDWTYYDKSNCNLALTTADVNNDAMLAKIKSVSTGYTDPKVMAILEASPHFAEVNDGDIGNSQTGIGYSKDNTVAVTASGSFGFDIMAGFEYVAPLIETGGGVEFNTSHTFTVGATKSTSKEITVEYSNDTNDNMVLMYATPMTYYEYQVKYPDGTKKGNSPKLTSSMTLAVPGNPSMNMVSVDTYNKAASAYEGMQQIGSNLHLGTSGQPNTYRSSLPSGSHSEQSGKVGHYKDSGTQLQSFTTATSSGVNFEYSYEGSVQMYGVVGGFKAGGGYHWGASAGTEKVNTNTITKLGSVTGGGDSRYNFDWSFGTWTVPFNGDEVPVLGYVVSNVTAPPSPAQDLSLSEQTTNSMVLSWESGDRPAEYYKIYRYLEDNKEEPFVLIDTVDAAESSSGQYEYTLKDLAPNTKYRYAITSGYYTSQEESVESEIIAGTTLANDKSRPDINGPDNVTVQMNGSATFNVLASVPAEYSSTRYQWQQRLPGKKWGNIEGAAKDSYTVKSVTSDLNGAMYRCVVTCYDGARTPISFYSDAATLTVGTPQATAGLTVSGTSEGSGTQEKPYIGQSNFNTVKTTTESVETTVPCTVEAGDLTLNVYKVNGQEGKYVGIGEKKETNGSISTVYYAVTKTGETYTAGSELTMNTTYQWKNSSADAAVPSTITPETVVIDKNENENENAKAKAFTLDSATNTPTDAEYDESKYRNGEQYLIHGKDTVTENGTTFERYILSTMAKSTSGSAGAEEDTYTVKYYQLVKKAENSYELTKLTCTQQTKLGDYEEPSFTLVTKKTTVENKVTTSTPGSGTALTLTTKTAEKTAEKNGAALGNVEYTLTITNTSDGTVSTIVGRTDSSGTDSKTWTAPTAGLYAITTTATGGLTSDTVYYLAGVQSVEDGETSTTETVYTLESTVGKENKITSVYGTPIALTVQQQTVTKNGNNVTAGNKTEVEGNITYTWRQSGQSESSEKPITDSTFRPEKAGTYIITAYQNYSDTSKRTKLASTTITVKRKPLELYVTWPGDNENHNSTEAPDSKSALVVKADALESGDALPSAITAVCALYDDKGNRKNVSGRFEVTIAVNGEDAAVKSLLEKYELNLTKRMLVVKQDTLSVTYRAGEGGSLSASYNSGNLDQKFESGKNIAKNTRLMFDAKSNDGFLVKEWKVNGQSITGNTKYKVTEILSNGKKVGERLTVAALTEKLDVEVSFSSDSHTITFSSGEGGKLTAALKDGGAVTTGQKIAEGANVTFTAAPNSGMSVARWVVDEKPYYWPGTTDLYRESTLTLENVQKDRKVAVEFSKAGTYRLTFNIESETGSTLPSVQTSAKLADGTAADLNAVPDGAAVTFALENLGSNYTVKTWKVDGKEAANSGTQKQFTLRNITGTHTVTAVINAAQEVTLTFKAVDAKGDLINADIASVTAKIKNGNVITSGSTVGNYSTIEFAAAVNENYYVSKWTGAEADTKDSAKASIASLEKTTDVIAHIAEKPQVTAAAAENGAVTVKGTRVNEVSITKDSTNTHVDYDSAITITAEPEEGYYVKSLTVGGKTFDYDSQNTYQSGTRTETVKNITADTVVTAVFGKEPVIVFSGTYADITAQNGSLNSGSFVFMHTPMLEFLAAPHFGYELTAWTVNGNAITSGIEQKPEEKQLCKLTGPITADQTVVVTAAEIPQYDFTLSVDSLGDEGDGGTVSAEITRKGMSAYKQENLKAGTHHSFYRDSDITITAVPNAGYRVQDWTINGQTTADTAASKTLYTLQGETTVQVRFVKLVTGITFGPTDETSEGGYISAANLVNNNESILESADTGANIAEGLSIKFTAEVKPGYEIEGWYVNNMRDDSAGTGETYTYPNTTSANSIYIAPKFQQVKYNITTGDNVTVNGQNSITARGGESLTFTAVPPAGQNVTGWTVNGKAVAGNGNTLTWTVENGCLTKPNVTAYHVEAQFSAGEYEVTYSQPANGTLSASVAAGTQVNGGTKVAFTAEPDKGYEIDEWTVNGHSVANNGSTYTLNVTENSTVAVTFKAMVPVSAVPNGRNGNIAITANGKTITDGYVSSGSDVTFTVTPENTDDMVQAWQVNGSTVAEMTDTADAPLTYTVKNVTAKTEVSATLIERPTYTITVTSEGSGTASAEPASVKRGGSTTITAVPSSNSYYLKEWSVNGGAAQAASGNTLALTEIRRNTTVKAVFDGAINYDVTLDVQGADTGTTVAAAANGKAITPQKNSPASVTRGSKVVFTATPAVENGRNKQMVAQWTVNGVDQNNISNELVIPSLTGKTDVSVKFVPYKGFAIPTGDTGWKVSDVKRVPDDTQPTSEIRKNGDLTFTVGLAGDYTVISKLVINGYDCINGKLVENATLHGCDAVEARKNANGGYTVTIKNVTAVPDMSVEAHQVIIGSLTVPEKFKNIPELDTVEKIQAKLTAELTGRKDGVAFYDIALKYYDGSKWITVDETNFPAEGVDVVLPYPNGTDSKDTFQIVHMLTKTGSEGEIENVPHTKETDGLRFHVTRLSPFGVSWTKYTAPTPTGGGGGGGAVAPTTYDIVIPSALANTVKADKTKAAAGDTVTLTVSGEGTLTVTDANGKTVALTDLGSGKYTFKMPSAKVSVGFKTTADQPCDGGKDCPSAPFTDVDTAKWYHLSVDYVLTHKMMNGVSSRAFAPNANLTRGMLVQILYNLEGKPKGTAANFSDVQADAWYAEAVGWAASNKVVTGYADGTFRPNAAVTREQAAAILYRYAQSKGIDVSVGENTNILSYVDVQQASEYAIPALQWAVGAGVLNGKNGGRLAPTGTATRAEIAAIMQRWCENIIK